MIPILRNITRLQFGRVQIGNKYVCLIAYLSGDNICNLIFIWRPNGAIIIPIVVSRNLTYASPVLIHNI